MARSAASGTFLSAQRAICYVMCLWWQLIINVRIQTSFEVSTQQAFTTATGDHVFSARLMRINQKASRVARVPFRIERFDSNFRFLRGAFLTSTSGRLSLVDQSNARDASTGTSTISISERLSRFVDQGPLIFMFEVQGTNMERIRQRIRLSLHRKEVE